MTCRYGRYKSRYVEFDSLSEAPEAQVEQGWTMTALPVSLIV